MESLGEKQAKRCLTEFSAVPAYNPIITVLPEAPTVRAILTHIGEPSEAPHASSCRGPPAWEVLDQMVEIDPIHPEPAYECDQSVSW